MRSSIANYDFRNLANNTIHFEAGDHVEDITLLPVQDKKVSLGRPEVFEAQKGKNYLLTPRPI